MVGEQSMRDGIPKVANPPLFVTALSMSGERHEVLLEEETPTPDWFSGGMHVRVEAPSGESSDFELHGISPSEGYGTCLRMLGPERAWAPQIRGRRPLVHVPELEVLGEVDAGFEVLAGTVLEVRSYPDPTAAAGQEHTFPHRLVVVRNGDGNWIEAAHSGLFYLHEVASDATTSSYAPWCLLDTGLPGAFWGFSEHHNAHASFLTAKRLLAVLFDQVSPPGAREPAWTAAAAHAILAHRSLLPAYGERILEKLEGGNVLEAEATLLSVLVQMAYLSMGRGDEGRIRKDLKSAIALLSESRPVFGETVKWLDSHFNVLAELVERDSDGRDSARQLVAIRDWRGHAYPGGQAAAYMIGRDTPDRDASAITSKKKV